MPNVPTVTIPEGTLIHIGGIPFRLTAATEAEGSQEALDRELAFAAEIAARPTPRGIQSKGASPA